MACLNIFCLNVTTVLICILVTIYLWLKWKLSYWSRLGLPSPPAPILGGNLSDNIFQTKSIAELSSSIYRFFKDRNMKQGGMYVFVNPVYMPVDLDVVKNVMQNDFKHFVDRGIYYNEKDDPISAHLFSLEGNRWRNLRIKLTPTFTSGKMKMMFDTLVNCTIPLIESMETSVGKPFDAKDVLGRFTTDVIGNCAFGLECNSLKEEGSELQEIGKMVFENNIIDNIKGFLGLVAPKFCAALRLVLTKKPISSYFLKVVRETVDYRESNNIERKDFMQLLIQLKNQGQLKEHVEKDKSDEKLSYLTFNEVAAQAFIFFLGGFETSSTTMTFCLYELSRNPEIQEKAREEVRRIYAKYNNVLTYEAVRELEYLEKVIHETLRKYPPLPILNRVCTEDYNLPDTNVTIKKGTIVFVPVYAIQMDEDYFPNPEKFDPERFSPENLKGRHPYAYFPFGEGPRICLGIRFGMMQTKVGLSVLLKNYQFSVNSKTQLPLRTDPRSFVMSTKGGMWLDYQRL